MTIGAIQVRNPFLSFPSSSTYVEKLQADKILEADKLFTVCKSYLAGGSRCCVCIVCASNDLFVCDALEEDVLIYV